MGIPFLFLFLFRVINNLKNYIMSEFNENPFLRDTQVRCFSNGTDAEIWQQNNCDKCIRYETKSKTKEEAKCQLAFFVDLGWIEGSVPLWVAKEIGCDYDPLYLTCQFSNTCRNKTTTDTDLPW